MYWQSIPLLPYAIPPIIADFGLYAIIDYILS
jgi:hypothetical protein